MPPTSDGNIRTVGCSVTRLIPDAKHLDLIRQAVNRVHEATIFATELLNLHIRRLLSFISYERMEHPHCKGGQHLDKAHPVLRNSRCNFRVEGGLVRSDRLLRIPSSVNDSRLLLHMTNHMADFRCPTSPTISARPFRVFNDGSRNSRTEMKMRRDKWGPLPLLLERGSAGERRTSRFSN